MISHATQQQMEAARQRHRLAQAALRAAEAEVQAAYHALWLAAQAVEGDLANRTGSAS